MPETPRSTRPTPHRAPSYLSFVPRRSAADLRASFDNLVALADAQERLRGAAKKAVWRRRGEPVKELKSLEECLIHAGRGGLRAGALAFNIRAGVNLFLLLFRIRRIPRDKRFTLIRHAVLGSDSMRFGAMLGMFVALYKLLLNALPLLFPSTAPLPLPSSSSTPSHQAEFPAPRSSRRPRLELSSSAQNTLIRKRARRWHAALAGAIAGGVAVLCERKDRRSGIGQQLLVRGMQGSWNALAEKRGWRVPYGAVWLFSICCGQIMYGTLLRPDTVDRSYVDWITQASHVPRDAITLNRTLLRDGTMDPALLKKIANQPNTTPANHKTLMDLHSGATSTPPTYGPRISPCSAIHNWRDSCLQTTVERIWQDMLFMAPVYGALHLIPAVLFRLSAFSKDPVKVLARALMGATRSSFFLGVFVAIYQGLLCGKTNLWVLLAGLRARAKLSSLNGSGDVVAQLASLIPKGVQEVLVGKVSFWFLGFCAGLSVLIEEHRRRAELALYVLPKALESGWAAARGKGYVLPLGVVGDVMLAAVGCAGLMGTYQNDPGHLGGLVRRVVYQFVGPN